LRTTATAALGAILFAGGLAACSSGDNASPAPATVAVVPVAGTTVAEPALSGEQPAAQLATSSKLENGKTTVTLTVTGLLPDTKYGSHVHTKPCGAKPADSGPHYQNEKDPVSPSVDSKYANANNEIWLDFTTDDKGAATSSATVGWEFRKGEANAIVVHATHTLTEHGKAGTAGDRLACLTKTF
jgi:Cu-Zn family superoxide dismutase